MRCVFLGLPALWSLEIFGFSASMTGTLLAINIFEAVACEKISSLTPALIGNRVLSAGTSRGCCIGQSCW